MLQDSLTKKFAAKEASYAQQISQLNVQITQIRADYEKKL